MLNRDLESERELVLEWRDATPARVLACQTLTGPDLKAFNTFEQPQRVAPRALEPPAAGPAWPSSSRRDRTAWLTSPRRDCGPEERYGDLMLRWRIACLVGAAITVSYLDQQTLPVAIKAIEQDIPITNEQCSFLPSSFLVASAVMYAGGGRLIDVVGTRAGFLGGGAVLVAGLREPWPGGGSWQCWP